MSEEEKPAEQIPPESSVENTPESEVPPPETIAKTGSLEDLEPEEPKKDGDEEETLLDIGSEDQSETSSIQGDDKSAIETKDAQPEVSTEEKGAEAQEATEEKPLVKAKTSDDEAHQIKIEVVSESLDIDEVTGNILDPEAALQAENIFGGPRVELGPDVEFSSSSSCEEEEELEPELSYLAEFGLHVKAEPIDREAYEEEYKALKESTVSVRRKNGLLHKKISEYYKKRKMVRVFEEVNIEMYESMLDKYEQKLIDLYDFRTQTTREREAIDNEMRDMRFLRDEQQEEFDKSFAAMQDREYEIGHGLIDSNTGKTISDKLVERLLHRQKVKSEEISKIRLRYIKRRDKVKEIDNKIKALETIGGTLHLMDFEQLRMENSTFSDKIEERDEELMRLRERYSHATQALAHIREKNNIIQQQIEIMHDEKIVEEARVNKAREDLNKLKLQRDSNRAQRDKLKNATGILTYPKLLLDMEMGIKNIESLRSELENLKITNKEDRQKLLNIRQTLERTEHVHAKKTVKRMRTLKEDRKYYHGRPTLIYPVLPKIALIKSEIEKLDDLE